MSYSYYWQAEGRDTIFSLPNISRVLLAPFVLALQPRGFWDQRRECLRYAVCCQSSDSSLTPLTTSSYSWTKNGAGNWHHGAHYCNIQPPDLSKEIGYVVLSYLRRVQFRWHAATILSGAADVATPGLGYAACDG
jgi:hypothetical protein